MSIDYTKMSSDGKSPISIDKKWWELKRGDMAAAISNFAVGVSDKFT